MNTKDKGILAMAIATAFLIAAVGTATAIDNCAIITSPGIYIITADIQNSTAEKCIDIQSDDVILDGQWYYIDGVTPSTDSKYGIYSMENSNVTIRNVEVMNFREGIRVGGKWDVEDEECIANAEDITIENCTVHDNGDSERKYHGIHFKPCVRNSIINNCTVYNQIGKKDQACEDGGAGIRLHTYCDYNDITDNTVYNNALSGIYSKIVCQHCYVFNNTVYENGEDVPDNHGYFGGGIRLECKKTNFWTVENNTVTDNWGPGIHVRGKNATVRYNVESGSKNATNNRGDGSDTGVGDGFFTCGADQKLISNSFCDNEGYDIYVATGGSSTSDSDENTCDTTQDYNDAGTAGCTWECLTSMPDLNTTEKSEEWVSKQDKTYNVTYTVKNVADAEAGASTTSIKIDGTEVVTDSVPELAPDESHTATVGPFTMSGDSDTIVVCADKDDTVSESDEENNCLENMFELPSAPQLVTYTISNTTITPPQTTEIDVEFSERVEAWINIEDSDRNLVNELYHSPDVTDPNPKTWDGTYTNGTQAPDGNYYVNVTGINTTTELSVVNDTEMVTITSAEEAPSIISYAPESPVSDTEGATRTFSITTDQTVNVRWLINGTEVQTNGSVTEASYTNASAAVGTWNVTAVVENANGTDKQTWEWIVTAEVPAPSIISHAPASPVSDIEGATRTFSITTDQTVNVSWLINGTEVQTNGSVTEASYTNASAAIGTWNVTAAVENANGADMQTWIWKVTEAGAVPTADYLEIENTSAGPGTYVDVPVNIKNVKNGPVQGIRLTVDYDESVLNLTNITSNDLTSNWTELQLGEEGHTMIIATDYTGDAIPVGSSGAVVLLNFSVIGSPEDTSPMNLSLIELSNPDGKVGTAPAKNGVFTVSELGTIIAGRITYSCNGTQIVDVVVNLTKGGTVVDTTVTNETGYYIFTSVNPDSYYVNASKPQFFDNSTEVTVTAGETRIEDMMLWLKGDLNNEGIIADAGDVVLMLRASVGDIPGDERYDLNGNGVIGDAGDVVLMLRASIGDIILW